MFTLSLSPVAFSVFGINVYWYGILYAFALFFAWGIATWILRKLRTNDIKVPTVQEFDSFMFFAIISVIIGARLGHVLFFEFEYYVDHPLEILMVRNGGLSFHGSCIGLAIYSYIFYKKHNYSWKLLADILTFSAAIGLGIGRIANFINQELYGIVSGSNNAVIFSLIDPLPRHPTQLYESFFEGFLNFWIMFIIFRLKGVKSIGTGIFTFVFCVVYSSARFVIEFYKEVATYKYFNLFELTVGQILSLMLLIFGIFVLHYKERLEK